MNGTEVEGYDAAVLLAARSGDADAITVVFEEYRDRLLAMAGTGRVDDAETVVVDAMAEALMAVDPADAPEVADFERDLFARVRADLVAGDAEATTAEVPAPALPSAELPSAQLASAGAMIGVATTAGVMTAELPATAVEIETSEPILDSDPRPADWSRLPSQVEPPAEQPVLQMVRTSALVLFGAASLVAVGGLFLLSQRSGSSSDGSGQADRSSGPPLEAEIAADGSIAADSSASGTDEEGNQVVSVVTLDVSTSTTTVSSTALDPDATTPSSTEPSTSTSNTIQSTSIQSTSTTEATTTTAPTTTSTQLAVGDFSGQLVENQSFRRDDLRGYDFRGAVLRDVVFERADLDGVDFSGATLEDVRFTRSDLTGADFRNATFDDAAFEFSDISGADFTGASLEDGSIDGSWHRRNPPINLPEDD